MTSQDNPRLANTGTNVGKFFDGRHFAFCLKCGGGIQRATIMATELYLCNWTIGVGVYMYQVE